MIKEINHDQTFLREPAIVATKADLSVGQDLLDTLKANQNNCIGMAANMIGINKAVIVVSIGIPPLSMNVVMYNPKITAKAKQYKTNEGCLSLSGQRSVSRYDQITVKYYDQNWVQQSFSCTGIVAETIQHEVDHLSGILI
ncbi:peptide deformylase [Lactobacillaceae bacterium 24-114]